MKSRGRSSGRLRPILWSRGGPGRMPCAAAQEADFGDPFLRTPSKFQEIGLSQIIEETGAEILLTECPSCLHNFRNAKLRKQKIEIYNITEFIAQLYQERQKKKQPNQSKYRNSKCEYSEYQRFIKFYIEILTLNTSFHCSDLSLFQ